MLYTLEMPINSEHLKKVKTHFDSIIWATAWDFQQCGMCDQQRLRPACAYAQPDQSLCLSLEYSMSVKLLTKHHLEFLSLKGGCTCLSESTFVKMPHCWKSHVTAHFNFLFGMTLYFSLRIIWQQKEIRDFDHYLSVHQSWQGYSKLTWKTFTLCPMPHKNTHFFSKMISVTCSYNCNNLF